jgi:hypothetical protein
MTTIKEFDSTAIMLRKGIISLNNIFLLHLIRNGNDGINNEWLNYEVIYKI